MPHEEIELKLTGEPPELRAFFDELDGSPPTRSTVVSTYYDTNDRRLSRRGYSLRVREREGTYELTLKGQNSHDLKRGEWNAKLSTPVADIAKLPAEAPRGEIGRIQPEELKPVFTSEIERTNREIKVEGTTIDVACDIGRIVSGPLEVPVAEIEFELIDGQVAMLLKHVRASLGKHRLAVSGRSKATRGTELIDGTPPAHILANKPALDPTDTIARALTTIVGEITAHIVGNLAAASDGRDPEGVHQLRVALRRLRSLFLLFGDRLSDKAHKIDKRAKRALNVLGRARDLDVFVGETIPSLLDGNGDRPSLARLADIAEGCRRDAYAAVRRLISKPAFTRFLIDLMLVAHRNGLLVEEGRDDPLRPTATALLQKRHDKALSVGEGFAQLSYRDRHRVRIALKKLRYACNSFQSLFPKKPTRTYVKRLARLQDHLGQLNDASVAQNIVDQIAPDGDNAAVNVALIKEWYRQQLHNVEPHMLEAWAAFAVAEPFWREEGSESSR